jgi:hypothetical protein
LSREVLTAALAANLPEVTDLCGAVLTKMSMLVKALSLMLQCSIVVMRRT